MLFHWILIASFHSSFKSSVRLISGFGNVFSSRNYSAEVVMSRAIANGSSKANSYFRDNIKLNLNHRWMCGQLMCGLNVTF